MVIIKLGNRHTICNSQHDIQAAKQNNLKTDNVQIACLAAFPNNKIY